MALSIEAGLVSTYQKQVFNFCTTGLNYHSCQCLRKRLHQAGPIIVKKQNKQKSPNLQTWFLWDEVMGKEKRLPGDYLKMI